MRAIVVTRHGQPPVVTDRQPPSAEDGMVLVDVTAAPLTPLDLLLASGTSYFGPPRLPYVPGVQGVGRLVDEPGRRVWFTTSAGMAPADGSMAQRVAVDPARMTTVDHDVPDTLVGALGLSAVAAHRALARGRFCPGDRVAVLGAGGVVGQVAVALASAWGADEVVAVTRGSAAAENARALGASHVVDSEGTTPDELADSIRDAVPDGVSLTIDPVWGQPAAAMLTTMASGGRHVNLGDAAGETAPLSSAVVRSRALEVLGYTNVGLAWGEQVAALDDVLALAADGRLQISVHPVGPTALPDAWREYAGGQLRSRVVVEMPG